MTQTESSSPASVPSPGGPSDLPATTEERQASGRAARQRAPRRALGRWDENDRPHDPLSIILAQNAIRAPELVPIRHQRMAVSPWNFYRGAAAVMAADLNGTPTAGLPAQLCGDAQDRKSVV